MKISDLKVGDVLISNTDANIIWNYRYQVVEITHCLAFLKFDGVIVAHDEPSLENYTLLESWNKKEVEEVFKPKHPKEDLKKEFYKEFTESYGNISGAEIPIWKMPDPDSVWKWIEDKFLN